MNGTHEMRMIGTQGPGREEWACPTCGRRLLLSWPPDYRKQILDPGDEHVGHVGHSPQLPTDQAPTDIAPAGAPTSQDPSLASPRRHLRETGITTMSPLP